MAGQDFAQERAGADCEMVSRSSLLIGNHLAAVICCIGGSRDHIELVVVKGELLFFKQRDGPYLPTLKLLHKCAYN